MLERYELVYVAFTAKSLHNDGKHLRVGISKATSVSYFMAYYILLSKGSFMRI